MLPQAYQFSYPSGTNSLVNYLNFPEPPHFRRVADSGGIPKRLSDAISASTEAVKPVSVLVSYSEIVNDQAIFASLDDFIEGLTNGFSGQLDSDYSVRISAVLNSQTQGVGSEDDVKAWAEALLKRLEGFSD